MSDYHEFIERCRREGVDIPLGNPSSPSCVMCGELLGERRPCPKDPAKRDCAPCIEILARETLTFDPTLCLGECVNCKFPLLVNLPYAFVCPKHPGGGWCFSKEARDNALAKLSKAEPKAVDVVMVPASLPCP